MQESQSLFWFGVVCAVLLIGYVVVSGRKNVVTWALLLVSVASVLFIATQGYGPHVAAALPAPSISPHAHPTNLQPVVSMIIMRMIGGTFLFILVGLVLLLALLQRARRMQAQVEPKGEWASCAECHQTARNMPEYRYRHGRAMIWGHLCHDCAQKFGAERA